MFTEKHTYIYTHTHAHMRVRKTYWLLHCQNQNKYHELALGWLFFSPMNIGVKELSPAILPLSSWVSIALPFAGACCYSPCIQKTGHCCSFCQWETLIFLNQLCCNARISVSRKTLHITRISFVPLLVFVKSNSRHCPSQLLYLSSSRTTCVCSSQKRCIQLAAISQFQARLFAQSKTYLRRARIMYARAFKSFRSRSTYNSASGAKLKIAKPLSHQGDRYGSHNFFKLARDCTRNSIVIHL